MSTIEDDPDHSPYGIDTASHYIAEPISHIKLLASLFDHVLPGL